MRKLTVILTALILLSCSNSQIGEFKTWADQENTDLLTMENGVMYHYVNTAEYHRSMIMECLDQSQIPYPETHMLIDSMWAYKELIQNRRRRMHEKHLLMIEEGDVGKDAIAKAEADLEAIKTKTAKDTLIFDGFYQRYDSVIKAYDIRFTSHGDYADSLMTKIMMWEDSLEEQGRLIGANLRTLRGLGLKPSNKRYIKLYQPVSEMQKLHKDMQSNLISAENAHSRYAEARQSEGFFFGPFMAPRDDVSQTERVFGKLQENMTLFRNQNSTFVLAIRR